MANNIDQELAKEKAALRAKYYNVALYEALQKLKVSEMSQMEQALYAQEQAGRAKYKLAKSKFKLSKYQEKEEETKLKVEEAKDSFIPKVFDRACNELEKVQASIRRQKRKIDKRTRKLEEKQVAALRLAQYLPQDPSEYSYLLEAKVTAVDPSAEALAKEKVADSALPKPDKEGKIANIVYQAKQKTIERQESKVAPSPLLANPKSNSIQDLLNSEFYSHQQLLDILDSKEEEEGRVLSEEEKKALAEEARQQALVLTGGLDPLQNNPYLNFITNRNSVKQLFSPAPSDAELEQILHAASRAPDHGRLKPYHFTVFREADHDLFSKVIYQACAELGLEKKAEKYASRAPMVIIVSTRYDLTNIKVPQWEQLICAGCATYGIQLAAQALGYDSFWSTGKLENSPTLKRICQLGPHDQMVSLLFIGSAQDKKVKEHKKRLDNLLSYVADLQLDQDFTPQVKAQVNSDSPDEE